MKDVIGFLGGVVAVSVLLRYAWKVFRRTAFAQSIATWAMWTTIDSLLLAVTWQAHKPIWLPLGWAVGAGLVTISLLRDGQWVWSRKETFAAICAAAATIVWQTQGATIGVIAGSLAMTLAGVPLLLDMMKTPLPATFHVWFFTCVACACTLIASDWTLAGTFLAWGALIYNGALCFLVRRTPRAA